MNRLPLLRSRALLAVAATALLATPSAVAGDTVPSPSARSHAMTLAHERSPRSAEAGTERQVARFLRQLMRHGYVSQEGTAAANDLTQEYCQGYVFSGLLANPQSPYIVTQLPRVPGQAPVTSPPVTWRLRRDEAIVLIGTTPPPEEYFSFDLTMMKGSIYTGPVLWPTVGDPVNVRTVHTTGPTPFDRPFALVLTGNRRTRQEVNRMLAASGLRGATNDMTIPPAMFRLGLDKDSDQFMLPIRTAVAKPGFEKALEDYRATPPFRVFRVRPESGSRDQTQPVYPPDPLPVPHLRVSGTGATELNLNPALQLLRQRIIAAHPGYDVHEEVVERGFEESYPGLQDKLLTYPPVPGVDALSYDADDPLTRNFKLPDGSFVVAYGTNHVATGQASYSSVTLYADAKATAALTSKNNTELRGSARDFIPDRPNADAFYAWTFSRAGDGGPSGPHVTMLPSTSSDFCARYGTHRAVDMTTLRFMARIYLQPATLTRPALSSLLLDRVLIFTPKKQANTAVRPGSARPTSG